ADAEASDDEPVELFGEQRQQRAVVAEGGGVEPDARLPGSGRVRDGVAAAGAVDDAGGAFDEVAEWAAVGGREGGGAGRVGLADPRGGVDLVIEHDQAAQIPAGRVGGDPDGGEEVSRAVRAGEGGVA